MGWRRREVRAKEGEAACAVQMETVCRVCALLEAVCGVEAGGWRPWEGGHISRHVSVRSMEATATERRAATYSESGRICVDGGRRRGRPQVRAGGGRRWEGVGGEATYREMCLCAA